MDILTVAWSWFVKRTEQAYVFGRPTKSYVCIFIAFLATSFLFINLTFNSNRQHQLNPTPPQEPQEPKGTRRYDHPLSILITAHRDESVKLISKQSQTLDQAVTEYRRRHGIDPPPHYDKWYSFMRDNAIPLVDEYDQINHDLRPFWGLSPAALRSSVSAALGAEDFLIGVFIRGGHVKSVEGGALDRGAEWRRNAIKSAIDPFAYLLPDMDLAFNMHDEPRVIIPYDQLAQLLEHSRLNHNAHVSTRDTWSPAPVELNDSHIKPQSYTPFMDYAHYFTWPVATLSCPPDSPARLLTLDGTNVADVQDAFTDVLRFVSNRTAFTDVCLSPSFKDIHGFFNKPNAWDTTHNPIPIFSPSKISSLHDILFPAPWYLAEKVTYDSSKDIEWHEKHNVLYWRGSTTSGYSSGGTWRNQSRQRFVEATEKPGTGLIYHQTDTNDWAVLPVDSQEYHSLFDVHFSSIGQCSDTDCADQSRYFDVRPQDPYDQNWQHKLLLDIDGNAFSGRFYTFLQSRSLTLKQALYREWHEDRIRPWVHYIPLGLNGSDWLEIVRFVTEDEGGQRLAQEIAEESRDWAAKSLRRVDLQAWMFRLLLEYARLVDDHRGELGFR